MKILSSKSFLNGSKDKGTMIVLLKRLISREPAAAHLYRVRRVVGGYEPQMSYTMGMVDGARWFPLNEEGYWSDPDAFSYGTVKRRSTMTKDKAKRAVLRAQAINNRHIAVA